MVEKIVRPADVRNYVTNLISRFENVRKKKLFCNTNVHFFLLPVKLVHN